MLDQILADLEVHCERIVTRLDDIKDTRVRLTLEEQELRAELKAGHRVFNSSKKIIDRAVAKVDERTRPRLRAVS